MEIKIPAPNPLYRPSIAVASNTVSVKVLCIFVIGTETHTWWIALRLWILRWINHLLCQTQQTYYLQWW